MNRFCNESKPYREQSIILLIGLDAEDGQWCEEIYIDGCSRFPKRKLVGDIIEEHNKVSKKIGRVLFGRFEILSSRWQNFCYNFTSDCHSRFGKKLIIVLRKGRVYEVYSTRVFKFLFECNESNKVPSYYKDLIDNIHTWFEISELSVMTKKEISLYLRDIIYCIKRKRTLSKTLVGYL